MDISTKELSFHLDSSELKEAVSDYVIKNYPFIKKDQIIGAQSDVPTPENPIPGIKLYVRDGVLDSL